MATELATAYLSLVPSFKGGQAAILKELAPAEVAAGKSGGAAGTQFASAMKGGLGGAALFAGVGAGALKVGSDFNSAYKTIRVGSGETGAALQGLKGDFKAVLATRPDSMKDVATAITAVHQASGATGKPLQELTKTYLRLSGVTGTDLATNLKTTRPLFTSFGITAGQQTSKLDALLRASRLSGTSVSELAAAMTAAGPAARTLGLDFDKTAAVVSVFAKSGLGAGAAGAALTKFISGAGARQTTASKAVVKAQTELAAAQAAVNSSANPTPALLAKVEKASQKLAAAQVDLKAKSGPLPEQFRAVFDEIKKAPSALEAAGIASSAFGARSGPKLAELLRSGKLSYSDFIKEIGHGKDTIKKSADDTGTMSGKLKTLKNSFLVAIEPLASGAFDKANSILKASIPIITGIVTTASHLPGPVRKGVAAVVALGVAIKVLGVVRSGVTKLIGPFKSLGSAAMKARGFLVQTGSDGYSKIDKLRLGFMRAKEAGSKLWGGIKSGASTVASYAKSVASAAVGIARQTAAWVAQKAALVASKAATLAAAAAEKVVTVAQWAMNVAMEANPIGVVVMAIAALVAGLVLAYKKVGWFHDAVDAAFHGVQAIVSAAVEFIRGHWELIFAILTGPIGLAVLAVTKNWDTIKGAVLGVIDWVKTNWPLILAVITGPIGLAVLAVVKNWDTIKGAFTTVKDWIRDRISDVVGFITGIPGRIASTVSGLWNGLRNGITSAKDWVRDRIVDVVGFVVSIPGRISATVSGLWNGLRTGITGARDWVRARIDDVVGFVTKLPGRMGSALSGLFDGIKEGFKAAWEWVANKWNSITLPKVHVPGTGIDIGGGHLPALPTFHTGGIIPGRPGEEVLIRALAGERVLTPAETAAYEAGRRAQLEAAFTLKGGAGLTKYQKAQGSVYAAVSQHAKDADGGKAFNKAVAALFAGAKKKDDHQLIAQAKTTAAIGNKGTETVSGLSKVQNSTDLTTAAVDRSAAQISEALRRTIVEASMVLNGGKGLSAYEKAQGSVYAKDAEMAAKGTKAYQLWVAGITNLFSGGKKPVHPPTAPTHLSVQAKSGGDQPSKTGKHAGAPGQLFGDVHLHNGLDLESLGRSASMAIARA